MNDFYSLLDQLKGLYEAELYEDVKILADLLTGLVESSSSSAYSSSLSFTGSAASNTSDLVVESKDVYLIHYLHGNAAFNLKEFKLAESLFDKALQINKSNLRPKLKSLLQVDCETDITIKYNLHVCLLNDKKYQEAFSIVSNTLLRVYF